MSTKKTHTKGTHRWDHTYEDAKAEIERNCELHPGYRGVVDNVRDVLHYLGNRNTMSAFDMSYAHRGDTNTANQSPLDDVGH